MRSSRALLLSTVSRTPPVIESTMNVSLPSRPVSSRSTSRFTTMPPTVGSAPAPVIEVSRTTSITSKAVGVPSKRRFTVSPTPASISSARSSEM